MNPAATVADHLDSRTEEIIALWRRMVLRNGDVPEAHRLSHRAFLDHVPDILDRLADRLRGADEGADAEGRAHGRHRWKQGYDVGHLVRELGHLRRALIRSSVDYADQCEMAATELGPVLEAIDEVIDDATAESVAQFQQEAAESAERARREHQQGQTALEGERRTLRAVLENLPVGVWVTDARGTILALNPEGERLQGFPREQVIGRLDGARYAATYPVFRPNGAPYASDEFPLARALRGETVRQEEMHWPSRDTRRIVSVNAAPLRDAAGAIVGAVAIAEDITARKQVEEHLRRQSGFTGAVTDSMAAGLYAVDPEGRLTFMNPAAERLLGWPEGELVTSGRNMHEAIHYLKPDGTPLPIEQCPIWAALLAGDVRRDEDWFVRRDGSLFPVAYSLSPILQDGTRQGAVLSFEDITERRRLEADLADTRGRFGTIVELSPVMIWQAGPDGRRDYFNRAWLEFRGRPAGAEQADNWTGGIHPDDRPGCLATYRDAVARREPFRTTFRLLRHDGQHRWVLEQGTPYLDARGRLRGYLGSCVDITERVALEEALRESRALAEEASQRKTRLLSALSHDARTPLNAVALAAQLLELHFREGADPEVTDCLRMIRHSVDNVQDLLGDLLNLTRIDAGAVAVKADAFALQDALAECLSGIEPQARLKGLECRLDPGPLARREVRTDRAKLKQIVSNLLSNALKFTARGSIRLFAEADATVFRVGVADTGAGIDPADHRRIFEEFATLENPHRPTGEGTGLGLAISQRLANLLGGEILVESALGRGSTFRLVLPASLLLDGHPTPTAEPDPAAPAPGMAPGAGGAILIAEDHLPSRQAMARVLRRLGYTPLEASNGRDAIALARRERPLAILMDVAMPVLDGIEATTLLRADPATKDLPIFALTGDVTLVTRERIGQAGITGFLEKPVTPEALLRTLATLRPADGADPA